MSPDGRNVVVVGGGVIGCAIARALSQDHDVTVVEKGQIAGEASGLAAGNVAPILMTPDMPELARHVSDFFRTFSDERGFEFTYRSRVELIPDGESADQEKLADLREAGFPVEYLSSEEVRDAYPTIRMDAYAGAVRYGDTGWVDPYTYANELAADARSNGAEFLTGTAVTQILDDGDRVTGVRTSEGEVPGKHIVVAAGWRSRDLVADYVSLPIQPYLTQCVVLTPEEPIDERFPMGRDPINNVYFRPEGVGNLLAGGGRTFDLDDPDAASGGMSATRNFELKIASVLPDLFHGFGDASIVNGWGGIDGATPDHRPIIDSTEAGPSGLLIATGFNGGGVRLSPVAAETVRSLVTGEQVPWPIDRFASDRFDRDAESYDFQKYS